MPWWYSMRWWLALSFAAIAAITAAAVALMLSSWSERAFHERSGRDALGRAVVGASALAKALPNERLRQAVRDLSRRQQLPVFVFDGNGRLLTPARSRNTTLASVPERKRAIEAALAGRPFIRTFAHGSSAVVAVPLHSKRARVLLALAHQPGYGASRSDVRSHVAESVLYAILIGAIPGLLIASFFARRLRRIAIAAHAIEKGDFGRALRPGFRDEVGTLAATIDQMRSRMQDSFARLQRDRTRLRHLLERLDQGVVAVDRELRVELANASAARLLDAGQLEQGDRLPEPGGDFGLRDFALKLFEEGATLEHARLTPREAVTYDLVGIPASNGFTTAILVLTDITMPERRERAEREFVENAAHELRTPVAAIQGAVEVLQAGAKDIPEQRDRFLSLIERQTGRLTRLGHALLVLARAQTTQEPVRLEPVLLRPLLQTIAANLELRPGVRIDVDCPPDLQALAERDLLEQVLSNLALNATMHTEAGEILLAAWPLDERALALEVRDTGKGIPHRERARVFDRFYRGEPSSGDGFGLGLAIVRQAVAALGGTITIDSRPAGGTVARFTLPRVQTGPG